MKECDAGRLQAYLDGALTADERRRVETHLDGCAGCRRQLEELHERHEAVSTCLSLLGPEETEIPDPEAALQRFRATAGARVSVVQRLTRRFTTMKKTVLNSRWRPAIAGLTTLMVLAILFSFAPVRGAAAGLLDVFRVRKFAVIPITTAKFQEIESLEGLIESALGNPTFVREAGPAQEVADVSAASELAGYAVRAPEYLPDGAEAAQISVEVGPRMHFDVERDTLLALAAAAGVNDLPLPDAETFPADLDFPVVVSQKYQRYPGEDYWVIVQQMPSPTAALPDGLDVTTLGEIMLKWLGVPDEDAGRLASTIDWTSTMVIPFPTQFGQFREVDVDGVTGLLVQKSYGEGRQAPVSAVVWQRDGMIYSVSGKRVDSSELLRVADSLSR